MKSILIATILMFATSAFSMGIPAPHFPNLHYPKKKSAKIEKVQKQEKKAVKTQKVKKAKTQKVASL